MDIVAKEAEIQGYKPDVLVTPDDVSAGRPYPGCVIKMRWNLVCIR